MAQSTIANKPLSRACGVFRGKKTRTHLLRSTLHVPRSTISFVAMVLATAAWGTPPPLPPASTHGEGEGAAGATFARYQVILDRQPFGDLTPRVTSRPAPPQPPPNPEESFVRNLRMCAITEGPDGVLRVGLISLGRTARPATPVRRRPGQSPIRPVSVSAVAQQTYYLRVGETSADGIMLVDANYDEEKALLRKDNEEHWISMGGGVTEAPEEIVATGAPRPTAPMPASVRTQSQPMSYADRQQWRQEVIRRRRERISSLEQDVEAEVLTPEDRQQHLQQMNMDLIRARGEKGPPLPIPLTQEQDEQLVEEGVLPAQDDESEE